jgi:opacity protein-like surface antigen
VGFIATGKGAAKAGSAPQTQTTASKLAWFLHLGGNFPQGVLSNAFDPGVSLNTGVEYEVTNRISLEGIFGYHRLNGTTNVADVNLFQFSANGKFYVGPGALRGFVNAGTGVYHFDPGGNTRPGVNVGGGVQYSVRPRLALEGAYNFHSVFTTGANTRFSTLQGGIRIKF